MKTKQLLLELLLINEKYSTHEIEKAKKVLSNEEQPIIQLLELIHKLTESVSSPEKPTAPPYTQKRKPNLKQAIAQLNKEDAEKYQLITQIKNKLEDAKQIKVQGIRDLSKALNLPFSKTTKRPTLIRQILFHLMDRPNEETHTILLQINKITSLDNQQESALDILSQAIITKK